MSIDWERVAELQQEIGEDDFAEVLVMFFEEMGEALGRLDAAAPPDVMAENLHFLKGSALNLGLSEFATLCLEAEQGAKTDIGAIRLVYESARKDLLESL